MEYKTWVKGVISGLLTDRSVESIKENLSGVRVIDAKRLKYVKDKR